MFAKPISCCNFVVVIVVVVVKYQSIKHMEEMEVKLCKFYTSEVDRSE
jgi:hypothetical protein